MLLDFTEPAELQHWVSITDTVMGGISTSQMVRSDQGGGIFCGHLSLAHNGGFAAIRRALPEGCFSGYAGASLRVKGDGRQYQFRAKTDAEYDGIVYRCEFSTAADSWQTLALPFSAFSATFRGRVLTQAPRLDPVAIRQVGFLVADKQEGDFALEIAWIDGG